MFRTSNPLLKDKAFDRKAYLTGADPNAMMTVNGAINKTLVLLVLLIVSSLVGAVVVTRNPGLLFPTILGAFFVALPLALVVSFKPNLAPILAPLYAIAEGFFVGPVSMVYEAGGISSRPGAYSGSGRGAALQQTLQQTLQSGIVLQAIGLTVAIFGLMLVLYRARILRATPTFTRVIVLATGGIFLFYMVNLAIVMFTGSHPFPFIHEGTPLGIVFSLGVSAIAALNFILDFDLIERGSNTGAPKYMEWYAGFALLVTVVWLYLEMLRLLNKLRR